MDSISCLHLATFRSQAATVSKISIVFAFSHVKAYVSKTDLISTNYDELESQMLHTKFRINRPAGSREEDF